MPLTQFMRRPQNERRAPVGCRLTGNYILCLFRDIVGAVPLAARNKVVQKVRSDGGSRSLSEKIAELVVFQCHFLVVMCFNVL